MEIGLGQVGFHCREFYTSVNCLGVQVMPKGMHNPWKNLSQVDKYSATHGKGKGGTMSEVERMGAHADVKAASGHSRRGKGAKKGYSGY